MRKIIPFISIMLTCIFAVIYGNTAGKIRIIFLLLTSAMIAILPHIKELVEKEQ